MSQGELLPRQPQWREPDLTRIIDAPGLPVRPEGPWFAAPEALPIDEATIPLLAAAATDAETGLWDLMGDLGLRGHEAATPPVAVKAVMRAAAETYRTQYVNHRGMVGPSRRTKIRILSQATRQYEELPLLNVVRQLPLYRISERNEQLDVMTRLLVRHEIETV